MKLNSKHIVFLACTLFSLNACKQEEDLMEEQGVLRLSVNASDNMTIVSRTLSSEEQAELEKNCKIRIYNGESLVRKYQGTDNLPASIMLSCDDYRVRVTAGDSVAASFEKRFFEGNKEFTIAKGQESNVEVNCAIANTVVGITWDASLKEAFKGDYQVTVTSSTGELVYVSTQPDAKGYFSLPADAAKLTCVFSAQKLDGSPYEMTKELTDLKASTLYNLTYKFTLPEDQPTGGSMVSITVDETPLEEDETVIVIKQRPVITCHDADGAVYPLEQPMYIETNAQMPLQLVVSTSSELKSLLLQNEQFTTYGLPVNNFDMFQLDGEEETIKAAGISMNAPATVLPDGGTWRVNFSADLVKKMTAAEGKVLTTIMATDANGKNRKVEWQLIVSNATVATTEAIAYEIWTTKATLHGKVSRTPVSTPKFRYRVKNTSEWTTVDAVLSGQTFSAEVTGLQPGTTYEYQAMDGEQASTITCEFTTETLFQPENAGFEFTSGSKPILIYGDGQEMWWDSGNHGSATMSKNVTTPDASVKHSGNQSILLTSQFVGLGPIGKFAAGNLFTGKYLKTDGTDGVLGWGRPCTSRPKALKLWVRYEPGTVDYTETGLINKGDTDKGIVYIAVGDWSGQEAEGEKWPFVVRTKKASSLFSKEKGTYSGDGIIGYGEHIFTEAYKEGDANLKEITIPLDYNHFGGNQRKPTSIIIVASASQYGDYFSGSSSSKMWLDDMELIYE